jgi:endonuclease/exonuclease/phosphatase family metal-dependent hydrolase
VATFNVRHCTVAGRMPRPVDLSATAHAIRSLGADIVALQELDAGLARSGRVHQPDELARRLGMHVVFAPAIGGSGDGAVGGDGYGIAVLSRTPVTDVVVHRLPAAPGLEPRVALCCRTAGVSVVVTHLSTRAATATMQFAAVARFAMRMAPPRIVCGDLNVDVHGTGLLAASGLRNAARRRTWPRARPLRQIDFVLHDASSQAGEGAAPRVAVSDHRPLVVDVTFDVAAAPAV